MRLSRAAGFRLDEASRALNGLPALNVSRPGDWGNPFVAGVHGTRADCVRWHAMLLAGLFHMSGPAIAVQRAHRRFVADRWRGCAGLNVACWCALDGGPCHGNTYLHLGRARTFADGVFAAGEEIERLWPRGASPPRIFAKLDSW